MTRKFKVVSALSILLLLTFIFPIGNAGVTKVSAGGYCDWVQFVADVTIPDGTSVTPDQGLKKTWRLKNIGTCAWTTSYKLVFVSGEPMGGVTAINLPKYVEIGQTIDLTVALIAPTAPGLYRGYWQLQNPTGGLFGYGPTANKPFWVSVRVVSKAAPVYDFVANASAATWATEATGKLHFPGFYGDPNGFALVYDKPVLENGSPATSSGILMSPPYEYNEHIYGTFPPYEVKEGDRFQATIGCEYGASDCEVKFVLQYQEEGSGGLTFFSVSKSYNRATKFLDFKLNSLAGKRVKFTLLIRPVGSSIGDHAYWVNPVIVNTKVPVPNIPTVTPVAVTAIPTVATMSPYTGCDRATFISDVTVPDGTIFTPGQALTKTWKLKNTGKCTWTTDYSLVFSAGDQMGGPSPLKLPSSVAPNQTIDLSLNLTAPNNAGSYRSYWTLMNAQGGSFGIGVRADKPFWLAITVAGSQSSSGDNYDFVAHVCDAQWSSGVGTLPCPSTSDTDGTVTVVNNPLLENNTLDPRPALFTSPQYMFNGYVQGVYPPFTVQNGDRFRTVVNCEYLHKSCFVVYRLDYQINNGPVKNLWAFGERYDRMYYQADIDLSQLAGQTVKFILRVNANGSPLEDHALWVAPAIVRTGVVVPPMSTSTAAPITSAPASTQISTPTVVIPTATLPIPTATLTPVPSNVYVNPEYGFTFMLPANSSLSVLSDKRARVLLPFASGTNLAGKYLDVVVVDGLNPCRTTSFTNPPASSSNVTINGIAFLQETGTDSALGNTYTWKAYSTLHDNDCISMNFVLYSTNNGAPPFDATAETSVFDSLMATFGLIEP